MLFISCSNNDSERRENLQYRWNGCSVIEMSQDIRLRKFNLASNLGDRGSQTMSESYTSENIQLIYCRVLFNNFF